MISLGPFVLTGPLGFGGMSVVYRGVHRVSRQPVAVKILTRKLADEERYRRRFRQEVRAMARLHHPRIARIWDMGDVDAAAAADSSGQLVEGSPWLAMELVDGRALSRRRSPGSWRALRPMVVSLLDALAHAHARGVVHRDLKPSNILLGDDDTPTIIDFGITRLLWEGRPDEAQPRRGEAAQVVGTPNFMAPEQCQADSRDEGPWTDLYALGSVIWRELTGRAPYDADAASDIIAGHLRGVLPPLDARFEVPEGIEAWLTRLLATAPQRRFRRASDVLEALVALDPDAESAATCPELAATLPTASAAEPAAAATGLHLVGLRETPLVSRDAERERLWQALVDASAHGEPRLVVLRGEDGVGKSRLARWINARAHATGRATPLRALHSPAGGMNDGLGAMLRRHFRCEGLSAGAAAERLQTNYAELFDPADPVARSDARGFAGWMAAGGSGVGGRFRSTLELHLALERLLGRMAERRPVIVWLDDLHWSRQSAAFVEHLLDSDRDGRAVLVVASVGADLSGEAPEQAALLEALMHAERAEVCDVTGLDDAEQRTLLEQLLPLDDRLVGHLVGGAAGSPLFAVQLLGHLIELGQLTAGERGFEGADDIEDGLPSGRDELWAMRLAEIWGASDEEPAAARRIALEIAGVLGPLVDRREWADACRQAGVEADERLFDELARRGLARSMPRGWWFEYVGIRDSLEGLADEAGRREDHHARCAEALAVVHPPQTAGIALRRARHLTAAGQTHEALEVWLDAEDEAYNAGDFATSRQCLAHRGALLDRLGVAADDIPRARGAWRRGRLAFATGRRAHAADLVEGALEVLRGADLPREVGLAAVLRGRMLRDSGELDAARPYLEEAVAQFDAAGDQHGWATAQSAVGYLELMRGQFNEALERFEAALAVFDACDDAMMRGRIQLIVGSTLLEDGREDEGAIHIEYALQLTRDAGDRPTEAEALRSLGQRARLAGDWKQARRLYASSLDLHEACGTRTAHLVRLDLAMCDLAMGDFAAARAGFERAARTFGDIGFGARLGFVYTALMACAAGQGEWERWPQLHRRAFRALADSGVAHPDIPWAADLAAQLADEAEHSEQADQARAIARAQRDSMG